MNNIDDYDPDGRSQPRHQSVLNVPTVIVVSVLVLVVIHGLRVQFLSPELDEDLLFTLAFFPARFDAEIMKQYSSVFPGGTIVAFTSFITYSLLHADWTHLGVNALWLLIFGGAVARRFGALRFFLISILGSIGGAGLHLATNLESSIPMVGASAAISAHMACASRFAFVPYGPLGRPRSDHPGAYFLPALSMLEMTKNSQVVAFLGVWFAVNLFFGLGSGAGDGGPTVAWQAHIGGFLAGLFLFPLIDPGSRSQ